MQLKSSNKAPGLLIIAMSIAVISLAFLNSNTKESKYVSAPEFKKKTSLDVIQVSIKEKYFKKLKKKRDRALSIGVLETSDSDYVPATITFNGKEFRSEIRLKGDWTDHLKGDKWSFRVKLKGDKTILGMRKFSIHHPKTRGYINEWLYHKAVKNENLIGLRYGFLEGAIHVKKDNDSKSVNKEVGIYAIEETFDKRTLESNKRKESVILKYSEELFWSGVKKSLAISEPSGLHWFDFNKSVKYPITVFSENAVLQDSVMFNYFKIGKKLLRNAGGRISISDAYDVKVLAMHNALMNLFGAAHSNAIINLRLYYNPITSKLEPIAFDGNSGVKLKKYEYFNFGKKEKIDSSYTRELINAMTKVSDPSYLQDLFNTHKETILNYKDVLGEEFNMSLFSLENLKYNQKIIINELVKLKEEFGLKASLTTVKEGPEISTSIKLPEFKEWINNNSSIRKSSIRYLNQSTSLVKRKLPSKSSYNVINNIKAKIGSSYTLSVIARKGSSGDFLGLRISGIYPDRVDAIFNLDTGKVKGIAKDGIFMDEAAEIKSLGNGWYECFLTGKIFSNSIKIFFGPTNGQTRARSWESKINENTDLILVPSSIKLKELYDSSF